MTSAWLAQTPVALVAVVIVFVPGLAVAWGLRLRGLALWALAPVGSTAVLGGLAVVYGALHVEWDPVWVAAGVAALALAAWLVGLLLPRPGRPSAPALPGRARARAILGVGILVGAAITAVRFVVYVHDPTAISQTNDAVFHLNVLRYILDTGNASSLHVSTMLGARSFYPAAWHAMASLLALATGCGIPAAANIVSLVIAAGVWTVGMTWFARVILPDDAAVAAVAGALSGTLWAFPMLVLEWGVLYPYTLSVALLPAACALLVVLPEWLRGRGPVPHGWPAVVLVATLAVGSAAALALAQPSSLLAWGAVGTILLVSHTIRGRRSRSHAGRVGMVTATVLVGMLVAAVWMLFGRQTTVASHWPAYQGKAVAGLEVIVNGQMGMGWAVAISVLMVVGLVTCVRQARLRWLAATWVLLSTLYVAATSVRSDQTRTLLLGAWYADPYRFAALTPLVVVPLAAIGLVVLVRGIVAAVSRMPVGSGGGTGWSVAAAVAAAVVIVAVRPIVQMPGMTDPPDTQSRYVTQNFLSRDGRAVLESLDRLTAPGARIIGNPSAGTAFGYVISGRDVLPKTWQPPQDPQWDVLAQHLRDVAADPAVCPALEHFGSPSYVLDFGAGAQTPGRYFMPGMTDFTGQPGFRLVERIGDASLWRITACHR